MTRFWWDFFGPRAEGTARHFAGHLRERLEAEGWDASFGVEVEGRSASVWCEAAEAHREKVAAALKPARVEPL